MKIITIDSNIVAHVILWGGLLVATAILYGDTESYGVLFMILISCATMSIAILASPGDKK